MVQHNAMKKSPPLPKPILFTKDGYQKILDEKAELLTKRPDAVRQLSDARSMGDLSENGYYHAAKALLRGIDARLRHLERLVRFGKVIEKETNGTVDFGSTVVISDDTKNYEYTVVGGYESDPKKHTISHMSPLGKALMHKKSGEDIAVEAPSGTKHYRIHSVR